MPELFAVLVLVLALGGAGLVVWWRTSRVVQRREEARLAKRKECLHARVCPRCASDLREDDGMMMNGYPRMSCTRCAACYEMPGEEVGRRIDAALQRKLDARIREVLEDKPEGLRRIK